MYLRGLHLSMERWASKKVVSSNVQPVFSNKNAKTLLQHVRENLLDQQFFGWYLSIGNLNI